MHELSIASEMLDVIEEALGGVERLSSVSILLGPLSGVSSGALGFCLPELAAQRGFGRPVLLVTATDARVRCSSCMEEYSTADLAAACPACGNPGKHVLSGRECSVDSVETEEPHPTEEPPHSG